MNSTLAAVSVIVPVHNEESVVRGVVDELSSVFGRVVVVDDGSIDASTRVLEGAVAQVLKHPINVGQGAALQTGITAALQDSSARYFVTFDADGQHRVQDAIPMVAILAQDRADIVFGTRFTDSGSGPRGLRRLLLRAGVWMTNRSFGVRLTDTHNGLRAFNRRFAEALRIEVNDMGHASDIIAQAARGGYRIAESPTQVLYTEYSKSKGQPLLNVVNIALDMLLGIGKRGSR